MKLSTEEHRKYSVCCFPPPPPPLPPPLLPPPLALAAAASSAVSVDCFGLIDAGICSRHAAHTTHHTSRFQPNRGGRRAKEAEAEAATEAEEEGKRALSGDGADERIST